MGIPEYEAKRYEGRVKDGGILVSVHCDSSDEVSRAKDLLKRTGAEDVASSGEKGVSTHTMGSDRENDLRRAEDRRVDREDVVVNRSVPGTSAGTTRTYNDSTVDEPVAPVRPRDL
jgi:hypothetical protein